MYGVTIPGGLDKKFAKLEKRVDDLEAKVSALLNGLQTTEEKVVEIKESAVQITEEVTITAKAPRKRRTKKEMEAARASDPKWGDPTISME